METIDPAASTRNVRRWQRFLEEKAKIDAGPVDGDFGARTQAATETFQKQHALPADGQVGAETLEAARALGFSPELEFGPDRPGDLRGLRPYFLVPLLELVPGDDFPETRERIRTAVQGRSITDVYVLSHGWHRNFFGAVSGYDRLVSRLTALRRRDRLKPAREPYEPLFLTMHWNSDPGEDGWVDRAGRRNKASFIANARAAFTVRDENGTREAEFLSDFEDMFELFSCVSAPGVPAATEALDADSRRLVEALDRKYQMRGGPGATVAEKTALAWTCFFEAEAKRPLVDQGERPQRFNDPFSSLATLLKFVLALAGLGALLPLLQKDGVARRALSNLGQWLIRQPLIEPAWTLFIAQHWGWQIVIVLALCLIVLALVAGWQQWRRKEQASQGMPLLALAAWLPVQIAFSAPMLLWALVTYLAGGLVAWPLSLLGIRFPFVFDERFRTDQKTKWHLRDLLAIPARWPLKLLRLSVASDNPAAALAEGLDNQFAFWDMQRKGVEAGKHAGEFLDHLWQECPEIREARFHFIGHSFGALVVANAARYLAQQKKRAAAAGAGSEATMRLQTVCLLQGAVATNWFEGEEDLVAAFPEGTLACVYSVYDSANGFFYPLANNGRYAAGYVGLCQIGDGARQPVDLGKKGLFAMLVEPPNLVRYLAERKATRPVGRPWLLNLDASRLIYQGPPATGGGHVDIFKDDVIHLAWAVTQLGTGAAGTPAA